MTGLRPAVTLRTAALPLERAAAVALTLLAATLAFEATRPLVALGPVVLTNVEALLFLTVGLWATACLAARRRPAIPRSVALPAIAWLAVLSISALLAPAHRLDAVKFVGRMVGAVLVAWATYDVASYRDRRAALARAMALGGLLVAVLGLAEAAEMATVTRFLAAFKEAPTTVGEVLRVSSTLPYATIASMVLELTVPLTLAWALTARRPGLWVLPGAGLMAMLAAQALTLTRGGLVALLVALVTMAAWAVWRRRHAVLAGTLATGALLLALWGVLLIWNPVARYRLVSETEQRWYQAEYQPPAQLSINAGETVRVPVTVTNTGARTWQATGEHAFALGYHLVRSDGSTVQFDAGHSALPQDVAPGTAVEVPALVTAPATGGEYVIEWDMVQEGVTWFAWEGAPAGQTHLVVAGTSAGDVGPEDEAQDSTPPSAEALTASEEGRLWLWRVAASMFVERPILGVGPDNFRWLHAAHAGVAEADTRVHANNLYVEWLVDTGLVGFAAFLWLTVALARAAARSLQRNSMRHADDRSTARLRWGLLAAEQPIAGNDIDHERDIWLMAVIASLVAWFAHGVLDFFYEFTPTYLAFALLCGLVLANPLPGANSVPGSQSPLDPQEGRPCASDSM